MRDEFRNPRILGELMNASHSSLPDDFEVTNDELDIMAKNAQAQSGCYDARMTDGGIFGCAVALMWTIRVDEMAVTRCPSI